MIFERDNSFTTSISLSYRLISALLVGGLNNVSILKLETQKIDWETDIEKLIKDLNMRDASRLTFRWEMVCEHTPVVILFFGRRRVDGEPVDRIGEFLVRDFLVGHRLQGINPTVADTIAELFLLPPYDFLGKHALR